MSIASYRNIGSARPVFPQEIRTPQDVVVFHQNSLESCDLATPLCHLIRSFQINGTLSEEQKKRILQVFNAAVHKISSDESLKETALNTAPTLIDSLLQISRGTFLVNPPVLYADDQESFENASEIIAKRCQNQLENDDLGELFHLCFDTVRRTTIHPKHQLKTQLSLTARSIQIGLPNAPGVREDAMKLAPYVFRAFDELEKDYKLRLQLTNSDQRQYFANDCAIL